MQTHSLTPQLSLSRAQLASATPVLWGLALAGALFHIAFNGQYGFHRDELDILLNARQLAWGYVAYPPLTPAIARLGLALFGPSLMGVRVFSAVSQGLALLLVGHMARDFGAGPAGQIMAALAAFIAPVAIMDGTLIQYMAFDYFWWVLVAFCLVRRVATNDQRWWLGVGAAVGLGMMTKFTMAFWVAGLATGVLMTPLRRDLGSRWLWAAAGLALLIYSPNLIWQMQHDFVSLKFLSAIHARDLQWGRADNFLIDQWYVANNPLTLPLWVAGLGVCLFSPAGRRFRAMAWMFLTTFALFGLLRGRGYYVGPAYVGLIAAGAAGWQRWLAGRTSVWRRVWQTLLWSLLGVGAALGVVLVKPVVPINSALWPITASVNEDLAEMIGWTELADQVAAIYRQLPESERAGTAILAGNYGEAGALALYGPDLGLPRVISGSNSLWERGYGEPPPTTLVVVGFERGYAEHFFAACSLAGRVTNAWGVANEESTFHTGLYVCRTPRRPWVEMWPEMRWFQ